MFLDIENKIAELMESVVPAGVKVFTSSELSGVAEKAQFTPAIHVIYAGIGPTGSVGRGKIQGIETKWYLVVAVKNARRETHAEADPLLDLILQTFPGVKLGIPGVGPMELAPTPQASHRSNYAYYPLMFTCHRTIRGS